MKNIFLFLSVGFICISFVGCAHSVHQVHTSDFNPYARMEDGTLVKGYGEKFVILGFTGDTDQVNTAYRNLLAACPGGAITGITTQLSTALGFFSWTEKALMQGLCVKKIAKNR